MKQIFIIAGIAALITTGCNDASTDKESNTEKKIAAEPAISLTDISTVKDTKVLLTQNWENKDDAQEAELSGGSAAFEMPYRGFSFFSDGTVVQNPRDAVQFGKWSVDDVGKL